MLALPPPEPRALHEAERAYLAAVDDMLAAPSLDKTFRVLELDKVLTLEVARWHAHATCQRCGEACAARPGGLPDLCAGCQQGRQADFVMELRC